MVFADAWAGYPGLYWEAAPGTKEMSGITFLKNDSGIVMLVDFYNYVSALDSYGLLIWHQRHGGLGPSDLGADFAVDLELE